MAKQRQTELEKQIATTRQLIGEYEELLKTIPDYGVIEKARIKLNLGTLMAQLMEAQTELTGQPIAKPLRETHRQQLEKLLNMADNLTNQLERTQLETEREMLQNQIKTLEANIMDKVPPTELPAKSYEEQIKQAYQLITEIIKKLVFTRDPLDRRKLELDLEQIKRQIEQLKAEIEQSKPE